jgi:hypothetical protein
VKDIAAFVKCSEDTRIRIFIDVIAFNEIQKHLKKYKAHNFEFEEIKSLILESLNNRDKYCRLSETEFEGYHIIIFSRGKTNACILCKEIHGMKHRDVVLIKLFIGEFEAIKSKIMDHITVKGGFDYEFEK